MKEYSYNYKTNQESNPKEEVKKEEVKKEEVTPIKMKTTSKLNIRKAPNMSAEIIRVVEKGTELEVIEIKNGWASLGKKEYCMSKFLK